MKHGQGALEGPVGRGLRAVISVVALGTLGSPAAAQGSVAGCGEWASVPSPNPNGAARLNDVHVIAPWDVWAVGWFDGPLDGFAWQDMNAPWPANRDGSVYTGASGEQLYDVVALPSGEAWAVGRYWHEEPSGVITWPGVALRWNGGGFDVFELPMVSPSGRQWANAVAALSSGDVWAVGDGDGASSPAYIWHWNGSSWSPVPGPTPGADRALNAVIALAADDVWAGGWYRDASYNYFPLILHWNGSSWTQVPTPAGG